MVGEGGEVVSAGSDMELDRTGSPTIYSPAVTAPDAVQEAKPGPEEVLEQSVPDISSLPVENAAVCNETIETPSTTESSTEVVTSIETLQEDLQSTVILPPSSQHPPEVCTPVDENHELTPVASLPLVESITIEEVISMPASSLSDVIIEDAAASPGSDVNVLPLVRPETQRSAPIAIPVQRSRPQQQPPVQAVPVQVVPVQAVPAQVVPVQVVPVQRQVLPRAVPQTRPSSTPIPRPKRQEPPMTLPVHEAIADRRKMRPSKARSYSPTQTASVLTSRPFKMTSELLIMHLNQ